jgi:tellurite resistance protein
MSIAAFLPLNPIPTQAHADALLELAFLVTAADGKLAAEEVAAFRELTGRIRGKPATDDEIGELYTRFTRALEGTNCVDRVKVVAPTVPAELREPAFRAALAMALIDRDASPSEDALIDALFHSLELDATRAEALAKDVRVALSPPPGSPPPSAATTTTTT